MLTKSAELIRELANVPEHGKAEIINGKVVRMSPTGGRPGRASGTVYVGLLRHEQEQGGGYALPGNVGFLVDLPNRGSFSRTPPGQSRRSVRAELPPIRQSCRRAG